MKEQLTLEMLCSYLPYGLKVTFEGDEHEHELVGIVDDTNGIKLISPFNDYGNADISSVKPIFRNLKTDLTREIEHNGERFVPFMKIEELFCEGYNDLVVEYNPFKIGFCNRSMGTVQLISFEVIQKLLSWHFWIYDQSYFEKGIIIDFNELNK